MAEGGLCLREIPFEHFVQSRNNLARGCWPLFRSPRVVCFLRYIRAENVCQWPSPQAPISNWREHTIERNRLASKGQCDCAPHTTAFYVALLWIDLHLAGLQTPRTRPQPMARNDPCQVPPYGPSALPFFPNQPDMNSGSPAGSKC